MSIRYGIEVDHDGATEYYSANGYTSLDLCDKTFNFAQLGEWEEYVKNDLAAGSIGSYQLVEIELKATAAPGLDNEISDAITEKALAKLNPLERTILGV